MEMSGLCVSALSLDCEICRGHTSIKISILTQRWNQDINVESATLPLAVPPYRTHAGLAMQEATTRTLFQEEICFWSPDLFQIRMKPPQKFIISMNEKIMEKWSSFLRTQQLKSDLIHCNLLYINVYVCIYRFFFLLVRSMHKMRKEKPFFSNIRNGIDWHCCHTSHLLLLLTPPQFFHKKFWQK